VSTKSRRRARGERLIAVAIFALSAAAQAQMTQDYFATGIGSFGNSISPVGSPSDQVPFLAYGADVGLGETDNVNLSSTNKTTQTIATADVDFGVNQQTRLLQVRAVGTFSDLSYLEGAYGNQLIGRFDGGAQFALVPDRLVWVLRDDFGQTTLDPFTPVTPNNLQDVNYVSTGPNLYLRLGGTGFLNASARYADAYYQTSPYDSNRLLATLAAGLQLSARSTISLNGGAERVLFQNTAVNNDFDRYSVYARFEAQGARTNVALDLGGTRVQQHGDATGVPPTSVIGTAGTVNFSTGPRDALVALPLQITGAPITLTSTSAPHDTTTTEPLGRVELGRTLSPSAKVTFTAGRELTDATSSFSTQQGGIIGTINYAPTPLTSDVYTSTYASAGWQYVRNRTTVALTGRWEKDAYPGASEFDLTTEGAQLFVQRQLTHALSAQLVGQFSRFDYTNAIIPPVLGSAESKTGLVGAALIWHHGRALEVRMRYEHSDYSVATGNSGYQENRIFVTVGYRPFSRFADTELSEPPITN
jgi:hypothetical protein